MKQGLWFALDDLYGRYYAAARGGVGRGRSYAYADADTDEEVEAKEGVDVVEDEELIGRGGDDTVDAASGRGGMGRIRLCP